MFGLLRDVLLGFWKIMTRDELRSTLFVLEHLPGPVGLLGSAAQHVVSLSAASDLDELSDAVAGTGNPNEGN